MLACVECIVFVSDGCTIAAFVSGWYEVEKVCMFCSSSVLSKSSSGSSAGRNSDGLLTLKGYCALATFSGVPTT